MRRGASAAAALLALASAGCGLFHRQPPLPPVVIVEPPILLPAPASQAPEPPPAVLVPLADSPPLWLLAWRLPSPPPPPRRVAEAPPRSDHALPAPLPPVQAPAPPQMTAGLSPEQQRAYRARTLLLLQQTQRELDVLNRQQLNAEGAATRSQAGEYVRQAQQALDQGDVVRAETLAQKAETLARFLLGG